MYSTKLGAILAGFMAAQALGATTVQYTLEVGGNNNRSSWKVTSGPACNPAFFQSGTTANGTSQPCIVTWAARVSVTGTYSVDGLAPLGVANTVFNLELRDGTDTVVANFGKGSASAKGFFSSINDGTARSGCFTTTDPDEAAAFPVSFSVDWGSVVNGRLIDYAKDGDNTGGPGLTYFQYPSTLSFPATSTCPSGTLCGVGAGYPSYTPNACPIDCGFGAANGFAMPGLGYYAANPGPCGIDLGDVAIIEGQINMDGMGAGTFKLVLTPGSGTNLIKNVACDQDPGAFAVAAATNGGDTVAGDDITFTVDCGGACSRTIVGRHVFYNNSFYDTASTACNNTFNGGQPCNDNSAVAPNVIALLPGQAPIVPPLGTQGVNSNYSSYTKGINGIMVDVQYAGCAALPAGPLTAPQIAATFEFVEGGRAVSNAFTGAVRVPTSATVAPHPTLANTDRITIIFADNSSTNSRWLRTRVLAGGAIDGLGAEDRFYFGLAKAEYMSVSSTNALTNNVDQGDAQSHPRSFLNRAPIDYSYDSNRDSLVNNVDQSEAQSNPTSFLNCLQLTGVAP